MSIAAVVVSHGHASELEESLPVLARQLDEIVLVANRPGSVPTDVYGARVLENERPRSYAANVNAGIAATGGNPIVVCNPDAVPEPGSVSVLAGFLREHPRCGIAGPQLRDPDGSWQPSRRAFPTVSGTLVRRTPLRLAFPPLERQRRHYQLDERPQHPVPADWLLGGFLMLRRELLDQIGGYDAAFRMYGEDIDLAYRAARAGWERWYVPEAVVRHRWDALTDKRFLTRRTLWHWQGILRFVRKHPERLLALR